ncbi:hypothetical protein [Sulfobacillus harzensis]|uniref:Extradiol ring-cleavage dioxygenase class III enzyme subunit B domain-containing protein n=1 Tax=Sulfobacillus harzensis TaxID=2729629 RepID=A0A7Y0L2J4_9FIRM|nr:hypothetical protein [Sulfobacillus harzensis]NMP22122.1 hypothetical protein [Sulfobacillus harzensis]
MALVACALMPHGSQAVPEIRDPDFPRFQTVTEGLQQAARILGENPARTAVILTPHGIRAENMMTISDSETVRGVLDETDTPLVEVFSVNRPLARSILQEAEGHGFPMAALSAGASNGPHCQLPLDWGAQVPLHFLSGAVADLNTVVMTPSRMWPLGRLFAFGQMLGTVLERHPDPVWLIASADMAHAHNAEGPYGFHPAAAAFDTWFQDVVMRQDWAELVAVDMSWVQDAKPDALWQMVILAGALGHRFQARHLGYDCPTYFGMMSAAFSPL